MAKLIVCALLDSIQATAFFILLSQIILHGKESWFMPM